jgi:hypothetical protein
MAKFRTRQGMVIHNLKEYVENWISDKPNAEIYIGCDSQTRDKKIDYAVSVCMYEPGKGGHIINKKETESMKPNNYMRLWEEVNKSVIVADILKGIDRKITIHVDYNSNPNEKSHELYDAGIGYAKSMGYEAAGKPHAWAATHAADKIVKKH